MQYSSLHSPSLCGGILGTGVTSIKAKIGTSRLLWLALPVSKSPYLRSWGRDMKSFDQSCNHVYWNLKVLINLLFWRGYRNISKGNFSNHRCKSRLGLISRLLQWKASNGGFETFAALGEICWSSRDTHHHHSPLFASQSNIQTQSDKTSLHLHITNNRYIKQTHRRIPQT